ncbi:MAG: TetR/AcrR family transcriptional regulator [Myxococcales bacterium]
MRESKKSEQTRALILAGAGRTFRSHGYGGAGVDGLAKAAGLTSGAFYAYFKSKAEAFREAVRVGMHDLEQAIRTLRAEQGERWVESFVRFYLGERRTCALTESCALQSLTPEVARADPETREAFEAALRAVIDATAGGMDGATPKQRRSQAIVMLAALSGGVSLARAVNDSTLSKEIADTIQSSLLGAHEAKSGSKRSKR